MKKIPILVSTLSAAVLLCAAGAYASQEPAAKPAAPAPAVPTGPAQAQNPDAALVRAQKPAYPLTTCVVSGEKLGAMGAPVEHVTGGRLVRLCSKACTQAVEKDPKAAIQKIDAAVVAAQKPTYPLTSCPVTGEKLGDKAVDHVYGTRLVRLANADAVAAFEKDPKSAMAKVDKALVEAQRPNYPAKVCVVSDEALGGEMGEPFDYLYGTRLVRFCCKPCSKTFEKDPDAYLSKLTAKK